MTKPAAIGTALRKALVEPGTNPWRGRIFLDDAPDNATFPYLAYGDFIGDVPAILGDSTVTKRRRLLQVDLHQKMAAEDDHVVRQLRDIIDNVRLVAEEGVFNTRVTSIVRIPDRDAKTVQHSFTVGVDYQPA